MCVNQSKGSLSSFFSVPLLSDRNVPVLDRLYEKPVYSRQEKIVEIYIIFLTFFRKPPRCSPNIVFRQRKIPQVRTLIGPENYSIGMTSYRTFFVLAVFPLVFLAVFFYFPLLSILKEGFWDAPGHLTFQYILATLKDPYNRRVMIFTIKQAVYSTGLTFLLGFPGAYLAAKFTFPGKPLLKAITTVPFVLYHQLSCH